MHDESERERWNEVILLFNQEEFIPCVLALESFWFEDRSDFFKGLIQTCVALNQLRLGLITSPRGLLATASALLLPFEPRFWQVDVLALRAYLQRCLALIPVDKKTGDEPVAWDLVPRFKL